MPDDWDRPLEGRVAAVTGSARGIGEAIAETLADQGASVLCIDVPSAGDALTEVANRIGGTSLALDITSAGAPAALAEHIGQRHARVDIFVHNAGVTRDGLAMRMSIEDWDAVINTNLRGAFNFTQSILRAMIKQRSGRIINITSVIGLIGNAGQTNYAASKAGLIGLTKTLARELASRGITVNAVAPGLIETDMTTVLSDEIRQGILQKIPLA